MITCLVGHRGVGKSSFLKRIKNYYESIGKNCLVFDLDQEIEKASETKIDKIFSEKGETFFRELEAKVFSSWLNQVQNFSDNIYIALGAGFDVELIPFFVRVLWIRRLTDVDGRIFTNRPRLMSDVPPLEEFKQKRLFREQNFQKVTWEELMLSEGADIENKPEKDFILNQIENCGGVLTLLPENFRTPMVWKNFISRRLTWGFDYFEIRDDLLNLSQIKQTLHDIPLKKLIYSFRKSTQWPDHEMPELWDWPLELGPCPYKRPPISSVHQKLPNESLADALRRLENSEGDHFKAALPIHSFQELKTAHLWARSSAEKFSFLPCWQNDRWKWYRILQKGRQRFNFIREGDGSFPGQPSLCEWLRASPSSYRWAAVVGQPVDHSQTPFEQYEYFQARDMSVVAVKISPQEWDEGALEIALEMGLQFVAVTSPLKKQAYTLAKILTQEAQKLQAVNTLYYDHETDQWIGHNTDVDGLHSLLKDYKNIQSIAVWGGGGTLEPIREVLPQAQFYSARSGEAREGNGSQNPNVVVWAGSRGPKGDFLMPPSIWQPEIVVDLNYREDSAGKEYALHVKAKYISGLEMFRVQAAGQRKFWESLT